jgi:hypothetical protein
MRDDTYNRIHILAYEHGFLTALSVWDWNIPRPLVDGQKSLGEEGATVYADLIGYNEVHRDDTRRMFCQGYREATDRGRRSPAEIRRAARRAIADLNERRRKAGVLVIGEPRLVEIKEQRPDGR